MSAAAEGAQNRLHNMEVEEVSLVNRPANKRKFLIVKGLDGSKTELEMIPRDEGGFQLIEKETEEETVEVAQDEARIKLSKGMKAALLEDASTALEKLTELTKTIDASEEVDGAEMPDDIEKAIGEIGTAVTSLQEKAKKKKPKEEEECKVAKAWVCPGCGYEGVPGKGGVCPKCGAKMEMVEKAANEPNDTTEEAVDNATTSDANLEALKELSEEVKKMLPRGISPSTREDINAGVGHLPPDSGIPGLTAEQMFAKIDGLSQVMKNLCEIQDYKTTLDDRFSKLEKTIAESNRVRIGKDVGTGNSRQVDGVAKKANVVWRSDMNDPDS